MYNIQIEIENFRCVQFPDGTVFVLSTPIKRKCTRCEEIFETYEIFDKIFPNTDNHICGLCEIGVQIREELTRSWVEKERELFGGSLE